MARSLTTRVADALATHPEYRRLEDRRQASLHGSRFNTPDEQDFRADCERRKAEIVEELKAQLSAGELAEAA